MKARAGAVVFWRRSGRHTSARPSCTHALAAAARRCEACFSAIRARRWFRKLVHSFEILDVRELIGVRCVFLCASCSCFSIDENGKRVLYRLWLGTLLQQENSLRSAFYGSFEHFVARKNGFDYFFDSCRGVGYWWKSLLYCIEFVCLHEALKDTFYSTRKRKWSKLIVYLASLVVQWLILIKPKNQLKIYLYSPKDILYIVKH